MFCKSGGMIASAELMLASLLQHQLEMSEARADLGYISQTKVFYDK